MGKDGEVFRNGKRLDEPYVLHKSEDPLPEDDLINFGPQKISTGNYFVMGDYRDDSYDSRMSDYGM